MRFRGADRTADEVAAGAAIIPHDEDDNTGIGVVGSDPIPFLVAGPPANFLEQRAVVGDVAQMDGGKLWNLGLHEIALIHKDRAAGLLLVVLPSKGRQQTPVGLHEFLVARDSFFLGEVHQIGPHFPARSSNNQALQRHVKQIVLLQQFW